MQLSQHFALKEFCTSQTAARMGREIVPTDEEFGNLRRLCNSVLEHARVRLGRPMVITSGLRPQWLNDAIGGSKNSAHISGRAADVKVVGMSASDFSEWMALQDDLPWDQVLDEYGQWTHISIAPFESQPRGQFLIARHVDGKTVYTKGTA